MRQMSFNGTHAQKKHGGTLALGRRKIRRPLCTKRAVHLVIKSNQTKSMKFNLLKERSFMAAIIKQHANKQKLKIYSFSVNTNHAHMLIKFKHRDEYTRFIRAVTGHIVKTLSQLAGRSLKGFFDLCPYTEVVEWGRQFRTTYRYIIFNQIDVDGSDCLSAWHHYRTS